MNLNQKTEKEARDKKNVIDKVLRSKVTKRSTGEKPVRTLTVHQLPGPRSLVGRSSGEEPQPKLERTIAAIALRTASNFSSSGVWVLSMLENTDQMYAL